MVESEIMRRLLEENRKQSHLAFLHRLRSQASATLCL
jgi:hypothetical protein